jgi:hypothetical protein
MRFLGMPAAASGQYTAALSTSYVSWCHSKRSEESLMIFRRYAKTRPEMFEAGVSCFAFRCSDSLNMTDDCHIPNLKRLYTNSTARRFYYFPRRLGSRRSLMQFRFDFIDNLRWSAP